MFAGMYKMTMPDEMLERAITARPPYQERMLEIACSKELSIAQDRSNMQVYLERALEFAARGDEQTAGFYLNMAASCEARVAGYL